MFSNDQSAPVRRAQRVLCLGLITAAAIFAAPSTRLRAQTAPPSFEPTGLRPDRSYFGQLPFESIDMVNGNVLLTFSDLTLPGNAGMDLRLTRTYNHQVSGRTWEFGFAGVPLRIERPDGNGEDLVETPRLVMADGTRYRTAPVNTRTNDTVFITDQFWRYTTTTRTLEIPNGWTATYESGNPSGGVMLVEVHDVYGNSITPDWEGGSPTDIRPLRLETVTQTLSATESRTVTFEYGPLSSVSGYMPTKMTFLGREWTYGYEYANPELQAGPRLKTATPPVGRGWAYDYINGLGGALTVTTPSKGTVLYDFDELVLPASEGIPRSVIARRVTGGRDIVGGEWTFAFSQPLEAIGLVNIPGGRQLEYRHGWAPFVGRWILNAQILRDGLEVGRIEREYDFLPYIAAFPADVAPVIKKSTLSQEGRTFETSYTYRASDFGDYHQPWTLTESGHLTRVTTRGYDYAFDVYQRPKLQSETVTVNAQAFSTTFDYDDATGCLTRQTAIGVITTFTCDAQGNRSATTDPRGKTTTFTYEWGVLKNTTRPAGDVIGRTINADGSLASETRGTWTTTYTYTNGRLTTVQHPDGASGQDSITTYDDTDGGWVTVTRGTGDTARVDKTLVDGFGRPRGTENALGDKTEVRYDVDGRKSYAGNPYRTTGNVGDTFTYDALARLKEVKHADNSTITYVYAGAAGGDTVTITDEAAHATVQTWKAFGSPSDARLVSLTDAASKTWSYTYDALGTLTGVAQPGGPSRTWVYDGHHRLESETHPESGTTTYTYYTHQPGGTPPPPLQQTALVETKTDARGQTFTYTYDANDRLTAIDAPGTAHDVTVLAYDALDQRRHVRVGIDGAADRVETTFVYRTDAPVLASRSDVVHGRSFETAYTYDGRAQLATITYESDRVVAYTRDRADRITTVTGPGGTPVWAHTFAYHPSGAIEGYTQKNGQVTTIQYDSNRLWPEPLTSGPVSLPNHDYDLAGNLTTITDGRGAAFTQGFTYDAVDRLKTVTGLGAETFDYDARGNRTVKNGVGYTYHATTDRLTSDGTTTYGYDGAGNLTSAGAATYSYTPSNMLATATVNGGTTTYRYDADNQRRMRTGPAGTEYFVPGPGLEPLGEYVDVNGQLHLKQEYVYADGRLLASVEPATTVAWGEVIVAGVTVIQKAHLTELRREVNAVRGRFGLPPAVWAVPDANLAGTFVVPAYIMELRGALTAIAPHDFGAALAQGQVILAAHFTAIRDRVTALRAGGERYYHLDTLGSVRAVTDSAGTTIRRHDYRAFGEEIGPQAGSDARRFTGKERDAETGLDYFGLRHHSAATGRLTTVDPLMGTETALVDPQRWNRYAYVGNRPTRLVDPDGAGWLSALVKLIAKGGDVAATTQGVLQDSSKVLTLDARIGTGERLLATASLLSEFLPISGRDIHGLGSFALGIAKRGDTAGVTVYRSVSETGVTQYVGITNNLARRGAEHLRSTGLEIEEVLSGLTRSEARAVEQALIQLHGLGRNGGSLRNKINSIAKTNPDYARELERGLLLLESIGYQ